MCVPESWIFVFKPLYRSLLPLGDPTRFATAGKQHGQGFDVACIAGDENCFDPNNDPRDGREDGPRDRAPGRRMRVLMSIWCFLVFCFAMTRHNSKTHRNLVNEVRWLDR